MGVVLIMVLSRVLIDDEGCAGKQEMDFRTKIGASIAHSIFSQLKQFRRSDFFCCCYVMGVSMGA